MLQSRNRALAIYGLQVLLAITATPDGVAKLAGADVMMQAFQLFGLAGCAHHVRRRGSRRRLYLLLWRGDAVSEMLLVALMLGTLGLTLGHVVRRPRTLHSNERSRHYCRSGPLALWTRVTC
jgi:hypothetical protein